MKVRPCTICLSVFIAMVCAVRAGAEETEAWKALSGPRTHILMRHAEAPGTGDPADFKLGDCSTQRNLSEAGREQARRIGRTIRGRGIEIDRVLSSQWCRAAETASLLALGPVAEEPSLNSFFGARDTSREQSEKVRLILALLDRDGERAILVTHQVNITALTGVFPASGEMIVVRVVGSRAEVLYRLVLNAPEAARPAPSTEAVP